MGRKKKALGGALGALLAAFIAGCGTGTGGAGGIAYMNHNASDAFGKVIADAIDQNAKSRNMDITYYDGKSDGNLQIDQFKEAMASGVKEIILLAVDGESIAPLVDEATADGITVIAINRDVATDKAFTVLSDDYEAGKLQAEYMRRMLPQGAKVVYLEGTASQSSAQRRWEGFKKECLDQRPDIELLGMQDGDYSKAEGMKTMALWLTLFPKIDAVICGNDQMALGAVAALKASNRLAGCLVTGIDATDEAMRAIAAGEMVQTVKQDAAGQAAGAFAIIDEVEKGGTPTQGITVPFASVTKDNLSQYMK